MSREEDENHETDDFSTSIAQIIRFSHSCMEQS